MIDFKELSNDGELWELFARDFFQEIGFFIEVFPNRGADGGKDLIISEKLNGNLGNYKFKWLVSCKNFAKSKKSVNEADEQNILERVESFHCDGFIGFYSTIVSSGLNERLENLKYNQKIKDFKVFDHKLIENYLIRIGFSQILMRYFPISYKKIKPLHLIMEEYVPLKCHYCHKDLLISLFEEQYLGIIAFATSFTRNSDNIIKIENFEHIYWACKKECDEKIDAKYERMGFSTSWEDIGDLIIPIKFLQWILTWINNLRKGKITLNDESYKNLNHFIVALSQKVFREVTEKERLRFNDLENIEFS